MLRIRALITGDLTSQSAEMNNRLVKAVTAGVAAATEGVKLELRGQLKGAQFRRFRNAIRADVFPRKPRASIRAAGSVYAAGDSADKAFSAFATGVIVTPKGARALAIPLHNFRDINGQLLGPRSSFFSNRLKFIPSRRRAAGTVGVLATPASGRASEVRKQLRTKGRARVAENLAGEWIPQFVLVRAARLPKLLSPEQALAEWAGRTPDLIAQAFDIIKD